MMTYEENVRAILETNFAGYKEEVIENAVKRIMDIAAEKESPEARTARKIKAEMLRTADNWGVTIEKLGELIKSMEGEDDNR